MERLSSLVLDGVLIDTLFGLTQWFFFPDAVMAEDKQKGYNANNSISFFIKFHIKFIYISLLDNSPDLSSSFSASLLLGADLALSKLRSWLK